MTMTPFKLKAAIERTKKEIYLLKEQVEQTTDPKEKRHLRRWLKELQFLQLWHLGQVW